MLRRLSYIENRTVLADSGEIVSDIKVRDPITALWVEVRANNGTTSNVANPVAAVVDAVEVVDGSTVLFSLDGWELFALTAYHQKHIPYSLVYEYGSLTQNLSALIPFGRFLGDMAYALDPTRFANLQVRVKWNLANVRAVGVTGFTSGSATLTIVADIMEGAPSPAACLMTKEHYAFTTAASGVAYIDLPTDYNHRALLVRCHEAASGQMSGISNVKLTCDQGKFIPFDMRKNDIHRVYTFRYPPFHMKHNFYPSSGDTIYPLLKFDEMVSLTGYAADVFASYVNDGIGEGIAYIYGNGGAKSGAVQLMADVQGFCPVGTLWLPWGVEDEPSTWLPASLFKSLRLELTMDNAGASAFIVTQQERTF
jgi:hypothetical protein